ncbi:MAG: hypothetical protein IPM92_09840 [Saprospiraceae bacterium]|nr:hypothetical protein [Saprospiraceae bacterium]
MSAKPKQMHQVKSIFQMKQADMSIRNISKQSGISRITIREYLGRIQSVGIDLPRALELSDEELSVLIFNSTETRNGEANQRYYVSVPRSTLR